MNLVDQLRALAASWSHERDRGYYVHPDGREERLWDSGCHNLCRRCALERLLGPRPEETTPVPVPR